MIVRTTPQPIVSAPSDPLSVPALPWQRITGGGSPSQPAYDPFTSGQFIAAWDPASAENTLVGSDISVLSDVIGSRDLTALLSTTRPAKATSASLGKSTASIADFASSASDQILGSTASDWKLLHDGTGCTLIVIYYVAGSATQTIWDTNNVNASSIGAHWAHDTGNGRLVVRICNGTAAAVNYIGANSSAPAGAYVGTFRYKEGRSGNEYDVRLSGASKSSGNTTAAPSTSSPTAALSVGAQATSHGFAFDGLLGPMFLASSYLSDADIAQVETWASTIYGT